MHGPRSEACRDAIHVGAQHDVLRIDTTAFACEGSGSSIATLNLRGRRNHGVTVHLVAASHTQANLLSPQCEILQARAYMASTKGTCEPHAVISHQYHHWLGSKNYEEGSNGPHDVETMSRHRLAHGFSHCCSHQNIVFSAAGNVPSTSILLLADRIVYQ